MIGGYLNGSGYPDPTAYKAMNRMEDKMMNDNVKRGEIWRYSAGPSERECVVVGVDGPVLAIYQLMDEPIQGCMEITTKEGVRYVHPARPGYTQTRWLKEYVQDAKSDEMEELADTMRWVFNLPEDASYPVYEDSSSEASDEANKLLTENQKLMDALKEAQIRERLMTDQYNMLLDRTNNGN